ncbi:hypothetical protein ACJX0J_039389, partial [Zea mays]
GLGILLLYESLFTKTTHQRGGIGNGNCGGGGGGGDGVIHTEMEILAGRNTIFFRFRKYRQNSERKHLKGIITTWQEIMQLQQRKLLLSDTNILLCVLRPYRLIILVGMPMLITPISHMPIIGGEVRIDNNGTKNHLMDQHSGLDHGDYKKQPTGLPIIIINTLGIGTYAPVYSWLSNCQTPYLCFLFYLKTEKRKSACFLIAYFWTYLKVTFLEYKCLSYASLFTVVRSEELWVYYLIAYALHILVVEFVLFYLRFMFMICLLEFLLIFLVNMLMSLLLIGINFFLFLDTAVAFLSQLKHKLHVPTVLYDYIHNLLLFIYFNKLSEKKNTSENGEQDMGSIIFIVFLFIQ